MLRTRVRLIKAHAYGNDFLLSPEPLPTDVNPRDFARRVCDRHRGIGADGLMLVELQPSGARMRLLNADGSRSEVSGNGVRCIGAWLAILDQLESGASLTVETDAGPKVLELIAATGNRITFKAAMGRPEGVREVDLRVGDEQVRAVVLSVGNPQCVLLGPATDDRLHRLAGPLATHEYFPEGTNVELADVQRPDLVRILIWERGVGPTHSSGTGTCAAAVAAAAFGGASRTVTVEAPGGPQQVEWTPDGIWLTGWAEVLGEIEWWHQ